MGYLSFQNHVMSAAKIKSEASTRLGPSFHTHTNFAHWNVALLFSLIRSSQVVKSIVIRRTILGPGDRDFCGLATSLHT